MPDDYALPCLFCDYDLRAHRTDPVICPECGNSISRSQLRGAGAHRRWARYLRTDLRMMKVNVTCILLLTLAFAVFAWQAGLFAFLVSAGWAFPPSTGGLPNTSSRLTSHNDRATALGCALLEWTRGALRLALPLTAIFVVPAILPVGLDPLAIWVVTATIVIAVVKILIDVFDPTAFIARAACHLERRLLARLGVHDNIDPDSVQSPHET